MTSRILKQPAPVWMSTKYFLHIHSTFNASPSCLRLTQTKASQTLSGSITVASTHVLSHGVTMQKTLKILFASPCNNRPSLALELTPPHTHISNSLWLIRAGQLVDFHHLMQAVSASLLSCCLSNCQLLRLFLLLITFQAAGNLLGLSSYYHTRWMHLAAAFWVLQQKSGQLKVLVCRPYISCFGGRFCSEFLIGIYYQQVSCNCWVDLSFRNSCAPYAARC